MNVHQPTRRATGAALAVVTALAGASRAQQQATTLDQLGRRAAAAAVVTVVGRSDPTPALVRLEFAVDRVLRGSLPARLQLTEPAGRCCGHALTDLQVGDRRLVFLGRVGPALHPLGGDRGVVPARPALVAHAEALLAAADAADRADLLLAALDADDARVRADAALALPTLAALPRAAAAAPRVLAAAGRELAAGSTLLPALLDAAARLAEAGPGGATTPALAAFYLDAGRDDQARLLRDVLRRLPAPDVRDALLVAVTDATAPRRAQRAAEYFGHRPDPANLPILYRLLAQRPAPRTALAISEALLAHGVDVAALQGRVPGPVLEVAQRRRAAPVEFRAVDPRSR